MGFSLLASLGIDGKNFAAGLNSAESQAQVSGKKISDFLGSKLGAGIASAGGFLAIDKILSHINEQADRAKEIKIGSDKMDVTIQRFQDLEAALAKTNTPIETLKKAYDKITIHAVEAMDGNLELQASFESLGVSMDDLKNKDADKLFDKLQRNLQGATIDSRKFKNLIDVMGKGSDELIPGMRDGAFRSFDAFSQTEEQNKALLQWKSDTSIFKKMFKKSMNDAFTPAGSKGDLRDAAGDYLAGGSIFEQLSARARLARYALHKIAGFAKKDLGIVDQEVGKPVDIKVVTKAELEADKANIHEAQELEKLEVELQAIKDANAMKSMSNAEKIIFLEKKRADIASQAILDPKDLIEKDIKMAKLQSEILDVRGGRHGHRVSGSLNEAQKLGAYSAIADQKLNIARDSLKELRAIKKHLTTAPKPEGTWITEDSF